MDRRTDRQTDRETDSEKQILYCCVEFPAYNASLQATKWQINEQTDRYFCNFTVAWRFLLMRVSGQPGRKLYGHTERRIDGHTEKMTDRQLRNGYLTVAWSFLLMRGCEQPSGNLDFFQPDGIPNDSEFWHLFFRSISSAMDSLSF